MRKTIKERYSGSNETEELDSVNAETRSRRNSPERIRRRVEATIEAKAKKRRGRQVPASAAWKQ